MNKRLKKKLNQAATATLFTATAIIAASPTEAYATTNGVELVNKAQYSSNQLKKFYDLSGSKNIKISQEFTKAYNQAKLDISKAEQAVKTDKKLVAQLEVAKNNLLKAARLIDALKLGEKLASDTTKLTTYIEKEELTEDMVKSYHDLSAQIKKAESVFSKVYGGKNRDIIRNKFLIEAKIARESVIYEVSRFILQNQITQQVDDGDILLAKENYAKLTRLEKRAKEIKATGNKLHPGKYPNLLKMTEALNKKKGEIEKGITISLIADSKDQAKPTIYGSEDIQTVEKDIVITSTEGTFLELKNLNVNGDILIKGENGSAGKVILTNVNVTGTVKVQEDQEGTSSNAKVLSKPSQLQLYVAKQSQISQLSLMNRTELTSETGAKIHTIDILPSSNNHLFTLNGDLSSTNITVKGNESEIKLGSTAKIKELTLNSKTTINADSGASLFSLLIDMLEKNTEVSLNGDLSATNVLIKNSNANITVGAGSVVKKIEKDSSVKEDVNIDNEGTVIETDGVVIPPNDTYTPPLNTGGNDEETVTPTIQTVNDIIEKVNIGASFSLPSQVEVTLSDGSTENVSVVWESNDVDTSISGKVEYYGTIEGFDEKVLLTLEVRPAGYEVDGRIASITSDEAFKYAIEQDNIDTIEIEESITTTYNGAITKKIVIPEEIHNEVIDFNDLTLPNVQVFGDDITLQNATITNLTVEETVYNLNLIDIIDGANSNHTFNGGGGESIVLSGNTSFTGNIKITSGSALQIRKEGDTAKIDGTVLIESEAKTKIAAPVKNLIVGSGNEDIEITSTIDQLMVRNNANITLGEGSNIVSAKKRVDVEIEISATNANGEPIVFEPILDNFELERLIENATDILENAQVGDVEGNYSQDAVDQLAEAKTQAKNIYDTSSDITLEVQHQVDQATTDLQEAITTFRNSAVTVDRSELNSEWNRAQRVANRAIIGTDAGEYPQEAHAALVSVIEEAKTIYENFGYSQTKIDEKVDQLKQAVQTFLDTQIGDAGDGEDLLHEGTISFFIKGEQFDTEYPDVEIFPYTEDGGSNMETYQDAEVTVENDGLRIEVTNIDETLAGTFYATIVANGYLFIEELSKEEIKSGITKTIEVDENYAELEVVIPGANLDTIDNKRIALNPVDAEGNGMFNVFVSDDTKVPFGTYNIQYNAESNTATYGLFKDNVTISSANQTVSFLESELALIDFQFVITNPLNIEFDSAVGLYSLGEKYDTIYHPSFADEVEELYLTKNVYESIIQHYYVTKDGQSWLLMFEQRDVDVSESMTFSADDQLVIEANQIEHQSELDLDLPLYHYFSDIKVVDGKGNHIRHFEKVHLNDDGYYQHTQDLLDGTVKIIANDKTYTKEVERFNFTELSINEIVDDEEISGEIEIIFSIDESPITITPFSTKLTIPTPTTGENTESATITSAATLDLNGGFNIIDGTVKIS